MVSNLKRGRRGLPDGELSEMMGRVLGQMKPYQPGNYRMTDDKAPVELLGMQAMDGLIQDELGYYKEIFQKEGISGLLNEM